MKTIAITVDEETLARIDELRDSTGRYASRSALVRDALSEYLASEQRRIAEDRERSILRQHKDLLARQLEALVAEQAKV